MDKNIKISLVIFVILVGTALFVSNKKKADELEKRIEEVYEMFQPKKQKEANFISGDYLANRYFEGKPQSLKLNLSPTKPTVSGARASLIISSGEGGSSVWKMGGWELLEDGRIIITLSGTDKEPFDEPEIFEMVVQNNLLVATKYNKEIYGSDKLLFTKEVFNIKPEGTVDVVLCGKKIKADNIDFGGFNFIRAFERVIQENPKVDFCNNVYNISYNFFEEILSVWVQEWRFDELGKYISQKKGPTNIYILSFYSKEDSHRVENLFGKSLIAYKFDFDKKEISSLMAFDGSFRKIGSIKESDFDNSLTKLSVVDELKTYFKSTDKTSDIISRESSIWWKDKDGYNILIPSTESFFIAKSREGYSDYRLIPNQYFYEELAVVKQVFTRRGFVLDEKNSSKNIIDKYFIDYIQSYRKGNELCAVVVNPDGKSYDYTGNRDFKSGYSLEVSCGNTLKKAQAEQIPFLDALGERGKNSTVRVRNQLSDFFEVGVGSRRGGSTAVLKKEDGIYRVLYVSQEWPYCNLIENENIPDEVLELFRIGGCWDGDGGYIRFEE